MSKCVYVCVLWVGEIVFFSHYQICFDLQPGVESIEAIPENRLQLRQPNLCNSDSQSILGWSYTGVPSGAASSI